MQKRVKSIVVVGGGSAGWITAGRIAAHYKANNGVNSNINSSNISNNKVSNNIKNDSRGSAKSYDGLTVTLVESADINIVGVGEGTWPTMRTTLMKMGISETDFIRECDATFKQGAKFSRWVDGSDSDFYYHPLMLPQGFSSVDLAPYWATDRDINSCSFSNAVCFQEQVCEHGLAPKMITTPEYSAVANYAYHLNAGKFAAFLKRHCTEKLGVHHIVDDVVGINSADNGDIASLKTKKTGDIIGDLFVDCTGFSSVLLGGHFNVPFVDRSDVLFIDTALAVQVPYECEQAPIASHTLSTAQAAGWIWDIGLGSRRGIGYVYSSRHTDQQQAEQTLYDYVGPAVKHLPVRKIPIVSGHRRKFWQNNCVAVGLSAGFLEPLEASALMLVELSATMLSEQLPACREVMNITAKRFNDTFSYRWDRIIDFLKLHYLLSKRSDNAFWQDNRDPQTIPDSLKDLLLLWQFYSPSDRDFTSNNEVFPAASYQYVLYGMGFTSNFDAIAHTLRDKKAAVSQFAKNQLAIKQATKSLPVHRDLINKIHQHGLQPI